MRPQLRADAARIMERLATVLCSSPADWPELEEKALSRDRWRKLRDAGLVLVEGPRVAAAGLYHALTRSGTSILGTFATLTVVFAGVIPGIFLSSGALGHCSSCRASSPVVHRYFDTLRFTVSQALTVPPTDLGARTTFGRWLTTVDTLIAAFSLGYAIWVITRQSS